MNKRLDLTIGERLALGFGLAGVLLALFALLSHVWTEQVTSARHHLTTILAPRAEAAHRLETAVLYSGVEARNYVLMPQPERLEIFERSMSSVHEQLQTLRVLPGDSAVVAGTSHLVPLVGQFESALRSMVVAASHRENLSAVEPSVSVVREELLSSIRDYDLVQQRLLEDSRHRISQAVVRMDRAALSFGVVILFLMGVTGWWTARAVREPARKLVAASHRLAEGDYGPALALTEGTPSNAARRDELAVLSHSFAHMGVELKHREERLRANALLCSGLAASLDLERLCSAGLELVSDHVGAQAGVLYLLEDNSRLRRRLAIGTTKTEEVLELGEGVAGRAAQRKRSITVDDIPPDSPFRIDLGVDRLPPRAIMAVPMLLQEQSVAGVLVVASVRAFPPGALEFLENSATQFAISVQNALAHQKISSLASELQEKGDKLQIQCEEIQAQYEEIQAQQEELQSQNEELQSQREELQVQSEELQSQGEALRNTIERLTLSEERYHSLFSHLSEGFALQELVFDATGEAIDYRFLAVNEAFEHALGTAAKDLVGATATQMLATAVGSDCVKRYAEVVRTGSPTRFEIVGLLHGRCYQVIAFRVGIQQFATLLMDVTDQKRAEEAMRNADRHKNEFLAVLSHELRNPLAPIRNGLYVLERALPGSEQAKRALAIIERQVGQLARLVEDLLDVTRISRGKVQLQLTTLELSALLRQVAEDHASDFQEHGLELTVDISKSALVRGDSARLTQVMGNLLQNAAKFTPKGGRVHLELEVTADKCRIRVSDSGHGMDSQTLARLFEPFMQAHSNLARTNCGLGLGLAFVKGIVELHGGCVLATSPGLGMGSEFLVELPISREPVLTLPPVIRSKTRPKRVLVVEDNTDAADSLREALVFGGHQVEVAYKGLDGIERARSWRPDVLLCDIGLPDIDGHEIARTLRRDPSLHSTFLVALTGYALPDDLKRSSEAGFDEHLAKPPNLERLEELLSTIQRDAGSIEYD